MIKKLFLKLVYLCTKKSEQQMIIQKVYIDISVIGRYSNYED